MRDFYLTNKTKQKLVIFATIFSFELDAGFFYCQTFRWILCFSRNNPTGLHFFLMWLPLSLDSGLKQRSLVDFARFLPYKGTVVVLSIFSDYLQNFDENCIATWFASRHTQSWAQAPMAFAFSLTTAPSNQNYSQSLLVGVFQDLNVCKIIRDANRTDEDKCEVSCWTEQW